MPIFEFRCSDCGKKFERIFLGASRGKQVCPKCRGVHVERLHSRFAAVGSSKTEGDDFSDTGEAGGADELADDFDGSEEDQAGTEDDFD